MRVVAIALAVLLVLIQWPLWFGKGGWLRVSELERQLAAQRTVNAGLTERNAQVAAEVASLREGRGAIEERARHDLNMVREGEIFFQLIGSRVDPAPPARTDGSR
jgi:cell division protein FtsB